MMLQKGVYLYECIGSFTKFTETSLPEKEHFYCNLNTKDSTDADCKYSEKIWKMFEIISLGKYHDLYVRGTTVLLANVFENFKNICLGKNLILLIFLLDQG